MIQTFGPAVKQTADRNTTRRFPRMLCRRPAAAQSRQESQMLWLERAAVARFAAQSQANCGNRPDHLKAGLK